MTIISQININRTGGNSTIQLIHGELSAVTPEYESTGLPGRVSMC